MWLRVTTALRNPTNSKAGVMSSFSSNLVRSCSCHTPGLNFIGSPFQSRCTGASSLGPCVGVAGLAGLPTSLLAQLLLLALSRFSCSQAAMSAVLICVWQHITASPVPVRTQQSRTGHGRNRPLLIPDNYQSTLISTSGTVHKQHWMINRHRSSLKAASRLSGMQ
jgi:hypothetical protein